MRHIGSVEGIGAPLSPSRIGGDRFPRYIGDRLVLDFHEGAGTTVRDLSGNENNGTFGAGAAAPTWKRNELYFDGTNDVVVIPDDATLDITGPIVVESYLKLNAVPSSGRPFISKEIVGSSGYMLYYGTAYDDLIFYAYGITDTEIRGNTIVLDRWYCAIGMYTLAAIQIYTDAKLEKSESSTGNIGVNAKDVWIGRYNNGPTNYMNFTTSFIRINATAFSAPQVLQEYLFNKWRN